MNLPTVPVYVIKSGVPAPTFGVITNLPGYTQRFEGVELTATKRMSHKWMFRGNASWNSYTEQCSAEAFPNPMPYVGNCPGGQVAPRSAGSGAFGNVFINSKWNFNLTGLYQLPWDFNIGASLSARQGYPAPYVDQVRGINGGATYVVNFAPNRQEVILQPVGTTRFNNVYEFDLRAAKDIRFMNRVGLTLSADLFNVPNQRTDPAAEHAPLHQRRVVRVQATTSPRSSRRASGVWAPSSRSSFAVELLYRRRGNFLRRRFFWRFTESGQRRPGGLI